MHIWELCNFSLKVLQGESSLDHPRFASSRCRHDSSEQNTSPPQLPITLGRMPFCQAYHANI